MATKTTPKTLGMAYVSRRAVWVGHTDAAPECAETLQDYAGTEYRRWEEAGYRYNRMPDGQTTAYRL